MRALALLLSLSLPVLAQSLVVPSEVARVEVLRRALPAVVRIEGVFQDPLQGNEGPVYGTGFFVSPTHIVTNYHVVLDVRHLRVVLYDHRTFPAQVTWIDKGIDIAVLTVEGVRAPAILQFAPAQNLPIGMSLLVVGSPEGGPILALSGILSGIAPLSATFQDTRPRGVGDEIADYLYTDAPVAQGNSGSPVLDLEGQVVGVIDSIVGGPGGLGGGIGLAIPGPLVHQSVVDLERYGAPQRGWLGASLISLDQLDPLLLAKLGLYSSQGAMINKIVPGGPAALAGLRAAQRTPDGKLVAMGDVILAVGGHPVANAEQVIQLIAQYRPGDRVPLIIWRSGRRIEVIVTMIARRG